MQLTKVTNDILAVLSYNAYSMLSVSRTALVDCLLKGKCVLSARISYNYF